MLFRSVAIGDFEASDLLNAQVSVATYHDAKLGFETLVSVFFDYLLVSSFHLRSRFSFR